MRAPCGRYRAQATAAAFDMPVRTALPGSWRCEGLPGRRATSGFPASPDDEGSNNRFFGPGARAWRVARGFAVVFRSRSPGQQGHREGHRQGSRRDRPGDQELHGGAAGRGRQEGQGRARRSGRARRPHGKEAGRRMGSDGPGGPQEGPGDAERAAQGTQRGCRMVRRTQARLRRIMGAPGLLTRGSPSRATSPPRR